MSDHPCARRSVMIVPIIALLSVPTGCGVWPLPEPVDDCEAVEETLSAWDGLSVGLPNPASAYCAQIGGTSRTDETEAGQVGVCILPDGVPLKTKRWRSDSRVFNAS